MENPVKNASPAVQECHAELVQTCKAELAKPRGGIDLMAGINPALLPGLIYNLLDIGATSFGVPIETFVVSQKAAILKFIPASIIKILEVSAQGVLGDNPK